MADRSKFEKMLELLVNENKEEAEELFHEIVVEKSREIYETLLSEEEDDDIDEASDDDEDDDDKVEESDDDDLDESDDDDLEEGFDLDEFQVSPDYMGGDPTDDFANDMNADMEGDMDGMDDGMGDMDGMDDQDLKSEVMDLKDAFEELKAEFEAMMAGEEGEEEGDEEGEEGDMEFGDEEDDMEFDDEEEDDEDEAMPPKESFTYEAKKAMKKDEKKPVKKAEKKTAGEEMREYVEKINGGFGAKIGGDNGTNTKSAVAGKNDMGGTTANILRTDTEQGTEANKGQIKGSSLIKQSPQTMNTKNINVPGGKAGVKHLSTMPKGHGAEKKGAGETADKSAGSMLNGAPKRAK